ncbi:hypothetical protein LSH36_52g01027 [Paralvinella palmiformis]|uniref:Kazal-like domain-containing protein n=1 Tax=Paralvinella palmiformis TaxID=53620 RepID=A0AAD9NEG5_9ANNE|nr:hypothetical protein LSH36_52g01027 [Paralvinella palmiformis]
MEMEYGTPYGRDLSDPEDWSGEMICGASANRRRRLLDPERDTCGDHSRDDGAPHSTRVECCHRTCRGHLHHQRRPKDEMEKWHANTEPHHRRRFRHLSASSLAHFTSALASVIRPRYSIPVLYRATIIVSFLFYPHYASSCYVYPPDVKDPCATMKCSFGAQCMASYDGLTARCQCIERCDNYGDSVGSKPVCGTDGKDYPNECEMKRAACHEMVDIEVKYPGKCGPPWFFGNLLGGMTSWEAAALDGIVNCKPSADDDVTESFAILVNTKELGIISVQFIRGVIVTVIRLAIDRDILVFIRYSQIIKKNPDCGLIAVSICLKMTQLDG